MKKVLVVVDMQNDFISGSLGTAEAQKILPNVKKKIEQYDGNTVYTRDTHYNDYLNTQEGKLLPVKHCIKDTDGWKIHEELKSKNMEVIDKRTFGSVDLVWFLGEKQFDEIEIVGLCTDVCVVSNALLIKAFLPEVKITVDANCCAGVTPESHKNALEAMKMCQINVIND